MARLIFADHAGFQYTQSDHVVTIVDPMKTTTNPVVLMARRMVGAAGSSSVKITNLPVTPACQHAVCVLSYVAAAIEADELRIIAANITDEFEHYHRHD